MTRLFFITLSFFLIMSFVNPTPIYADLLFPGDAAKTPNLLEFVFQLIINFIFLRALFYIIINTFVVWFVSILGEKLIKIFFKGPPFQGLRFRNYFLLSTVGYFIDEIIFFTNYQIFGDYHCSKVFTKSVCEYQFSGFFNETWVTTASGLVIFILMSLFAYYLLARKLYKGKKERYFFSLLIGTLANPWWLKILASGFT